MDSQEEQRAVEEEVDFVHMNQNHCREEKIKGNPYKWEENTGTTVKEGPIPSTVGG